MSENRAGLAFLLSFAGVSVAVGAIALLFLDYTLTDSFASGTGSDWLLVLSVGIPGTAIAAMLGYLWYL